MRKISTTKFFEKCPEEQDILQGPDLIKIYWAWRSLTDELARSNDFWASTNETLQESLEKIITLESEIAQKEKLASLGMISAGISHEIGNALNSIKTALFAMQKMQKDQRIDWTKFSRIYKILSTSTSHAVKIVESLSYAAKANSSMQERRWTEIVDSALILLENKIRVNNVQVERIIDDEAKVRCLKTQLIQVLMNLIINAIDAIAKQAGERRIRIITSRTETHHCISVEDNGSGIPAERVSSIFDAFYTTKSEDQGSGLGLYVVRKEIMAMDGYVNLSDTSDLGGAKFIIGLPATSTALV